MKKRDSGFTLIELLIVIAIIGILAAIAIPNLLNAVQRGKQKRSMSDMRAMATAVEAYAVDNNLYPVPTTCAGNAFSAPGTALNSASFTRLAPTYIGVVPFNDGWGRPFVYNVDGPGNNYNIISYGRNGTSDTVNCGTTTDFNDDIVYSDGGFIQWPEGAQQ